MSQGLSFRALADEFQIGITTVQKIVYEVCAIICQRLGPEQLPPPKQRQWMTNANDFEELGFPRAIGAMDGKHFWVKVCFFFIK